jgi:hypothetical protein
LPDIWAALLWQPSCILCLPAFGALDVFEALDAFEVLGVCACADIEQAKMVNAKAILKIDFITSPKVISS